MLQTIATIRTTLDTPMNRKWMPDADTTTWTSLTELSNKFYEWASGSSKAPAGLIQVSTVNSKTSFTLH